MRQVSRVALVFCSKGCSAADHEDDQIIGRDEVQEGKMILDWGKD